MNRTITAAEAARRLRLPLSKVHTLAAGGALQDLKPHDPRASKHYAAFDSKQVSRVKLELNGCRHERFSKYFMEDLCNRLHGIPQQVALPVHQAAPAVAKPKPKPKPAPPQPPPPPPAPAEPTPAPPTSIEASGWVYGGLLAKLDLLGKLEERQARTEAKVDALRLEVAALYQLWK